MYEVGFPNAHQLLLLLGTGAQADHWPIMLFYCCLTSAAGSNHVQRVRVMSRFRTNEGWWHKLKADGGECPAVAPPRHMRAMCGGLSRCQ